MMQIGVDTYDARILLIHEDGKPYAFTKSQANAKEIAGAKDMRQLLADWQAFAHTMAEAGLIAKPEALMNKTARLLCDTSI